MAIKTIFHPKRIVGVSILILALTGWFISSLFEPEEDPQPIYLIFPADSHFAKSTRKLLEKAFIHDTAKNNLFIVEEDGVVIFTKTSDLFFEIDKALEEGATQHYLFKLDSPSTSQKKILRAAVESYYSGVNRKLALRSIIIVLEQNEMNVSQANQFRDDLIYIEHNFGGLGVIVKGTERQMIEQYSSIIHQVLLDGK